MPTLKKRPNLYTSEDGKQLIKELKLMEQDETYNTDPSYSANVAAYPDHSIPFVDKHLAYLNSHPSVNIDYYLSNLRILLKYR